MQRLTSPLQNPLDPAVGAGSTAGQDGLLKGGRYQENPPRAE